MGWGSDSLTLRRRARGFVNDVRRMTGFAAVCLLAASCGVRRERRDGPPAGWGKLTPAAARVVPVDSPLPSCQYLEEINVTARGLPQTLGDEEIANATYHLLHRAAQGGATHMFVRTPEVDAARSYMHLSGVGYKCPPSLQVDEPARSDARKTEAEPAPHLPG
jgi:hypothetical protein